MRHGILALLFVLPMWPWISIGLASAVEVTREPSPSNFPLKLTDDRGRDIRLNHIATRIVSLSPNITELVFAAGAGGKLVGVSHYSDYPAAAKSVPGVGDSSSLDLERIIALKPDLVVAWRSGNSISDIEKLEKLGLTVFATEATRLEDVPRLLRITGRLAGTSTQAESAARAYEAELGQLKRTYAGRRPVRVVALIWHQPFMAVNGHHIISDIINICGGINVFASAASLTPVVSTESLLEADPQAVISSMSLELAETGVKERLSYIGAVRSNHLYFVHPDLLHRQTPRILQAAKKVCAQLEEVR